MARKKTPSSNPLPDRASLDTTPEAGEPEDKGQEGMPAQAKEVAKSKTTSPRRPKERWAGIAGLLRIAEGD